MQPDCAAECAADRAADGCDARTTIGGPRVLMRTGAARESLRVRVFLIVCVCVCDCVYVCSFGCV